MIQPKQEHAPELQIPPRVWVRFCTYNRYDSDLTISRVNATMKRPSPFRLDAPLYLEFLSVKEHTFALEDMQKKHAAEVLELQVHIRKLQEKS